VYEISGGQADQANSIRPLAFALAVKFPQPRLAIRLNRKTSKTFRRPAIDDNSVDCHSNRNLLLRICQQSLRQLD
jgi:hypothetical protein